MKKNFFKKSQTTNVLRLLQNVKNKKGLETKLIQVTLALLGQQTYNTNGLGVKYNHRGLNSLTKYFYLNTFVLFKSTF